MKFFTGNKIFFVLSMINIQEERVKKCGGVITKKADNCEARLIPPSESASNLAINMTRSGGKKQ